MIKTILSLLVFMVMFCTNPEDGGVDVVFLPVDSIIMYPDTVPVMTVNDWPFLIAPRAMMSDSVVAVKYYWYSTLKDYPLGMTAPTLLFDPSKIKKPQEGRVYAVYNNKECSLYIKIKETQGIDLGL